MLWSGGMTINSSKKDIRKLINHWYLESLTDIQLIQLHMVGSSFRDDYRLGDILQFILTRGVSLMDSLAPLWVTYACLTNPPKNDINAL
jgi:hypothetical protein